MIRTLKRLTNQRRENPFAESPYENKSKRIFQRTSKEYSDNNSQQELLMKSFQS